jgi:hypothetical protein
VINLPSLFLAACVSFNAGNATIQEEDGSWVITDGETSVNGFDDNEGHAERALAIIQHYGMNERCVSGQSESGLQYWLVDGRAPSGALSAETCFSFDTDGINVKQSDESWKIVEGRNNIFNFREEDIARDAHRVIQKHRFSRFCFVGRPVPTFVYLRK